MEARPQAAPLPQKRGEIGYMEGENTGGHELPSLSEQTSTMPTRHPADTGAVGADTSTASDAGVPLAASVQGASSSTSTAAPAAPEDSDSMTMHKPGNRQQYAGIRISTWIRFFVQLSIVIGTIVGLVLIIVLVGNKLSAGAPPTIENPNGALPSNTAQIFVYIAFGIAILAQLLFLERAVFHMRAERYCFLHPECRMPTRGVLGSRSSAPGMSFAPWNRLPLPTYAAALAQSGHGTGDVEDNIIAVPPPPAYGNTRDSTLVLSATLPNHLRHSRLSHGRISTIPESRPISYMTVDEHWEEGQNVQRAMMLQETLARLEDGSGSTNRSASADY